MLVLRQPMRVAMALIATMLSLGAIYGLLGVHFIAAFQVLIYVGAGDGVHGLRDHAARGARDRPVARYSQAARSRASRASWCCSACIVAQRLAARCPRLRASSARSSYGIAGFSTAFLNDVLAAVRAHLRAAGRRGRGGAGGDPVHQAGDADVVDRTQLLIGVAVALFASASSASSSAATCLVMLMCMELMLNGVNLSLVTFAQQTGTTVGAVLVFLIFVVATVEIALAIPDRLLLVRAKRTLRPRRLQRAQGLGSDADRDRPPAPARLRPERHARDPPRRQPRRRRFVSRGRLRPADRRLRRSSSSACSTSRARRLRAARRDRLPLGADRRQPLRDRLLLRPPRAR